MARHMASGDHTFRAVVTTVTEYADGRESRRFTEYFGPYAKVGAARAQITREQSDAKNWSEHRARMAEIRGLPVEFTVTVTGYPETSVTTWTPVDA